MSLRTTLLSTLCRSSPHRLLSTKLTPLKPSEITSLLSTPTWSVKSTLQDHPPNSPAGEPITKPQLHHLLRLSALPLPTSAEQEAKMIADLEDQLHFVRHVQSVDTEGVEPLVAIRDETEEAKRASEITVETLKEEFEREEVVGFARKIRRVVGRKRFKPRGEEKKGMEGQDGDKGGGTTMQAQDGEVKEEKVDGWELLKQAPNKHGRFVVVDTKNQ